MVEAFFGVKINDVPRFLIDSGPSVSFLSNVSKVSELPCASVVEEHNFADFGIVVAVSVISIVNFFSFFGVALKDLLRSFADFGTDEAISFFSGFAEYTDFARLLDVGTSLSIHWLRGVDVTASAVCTLAEFNNLVEERTPLRGVKSTNCKGFIVGDVQSGNE